MARVLKGNLVAEGIIARTKAGSDELKRRGVVPALALIKVGDRANDAAYERGARRRAEEAGVSVLTRDFAADVTEEALADAIRELNADAAVHGILMFRPLPAGLSETSLCELIAPAKDVDAATTASLAGVYTGLSIGYAPCTAQAVIEMLDAYGIDVAGKHVCVIGRSQVVGRPVAALLLARNATVTVAHSRSVDLPDISREADVVIVATGRARAFGPEYFSAGQTVIDVGVNWDAEAGKIVGDVDFEAVEPLLGGISPVPGGVGSVTSAVLVSHVVESAMRLCDNSAN